VKLRRHRDFRKLWLGQTVSEVGTQVSLIALPLVGIITLRAGPQGLGLLSASQFAPYLIVTPLAGVWLDGHGRRAAILVANAGRFFILGSIPLLNALGALSLSLLCGLSLIAGTLSAVFDVAYLVYAPSIVSEAQLVDANTKLETSYSIGQIGGPGLGGVIVQALTAPFAMLVDAGTYALATVSVAAIGHREAPVRHDQERASARHELGVGIRATLRDPVLRPLTVQAGWFNMCTEGTLTLALLYGVRTLHLSPGMLGAIISAGSVGGLAGASAASMLAARLGVGRTLAAAMMLASVGLAAVPAVGGSRAVVVLSLIAGFGVHGFGTAVYNVHSLSLRIALTPRNLRARVTATYQLVSYGMIPVGALLAGTLARVVGLRGAIGVIVATLILAAFVFNLTPVARLQTLDRRIC
jgi:MFS family permease